MGWGTNGGQKKREAHAAAVIREKRRAEKAEVAREKFEAKQRFANKRKQQQNKRYNKKSSWLLLFLYFIIDKERKKYENL